MRTRLVLVELAVDVAAQVARPRRAGLARSELGARLLLLGQRPAARVVVEGDRPVEEEDGVSISSEAGLLGMHTKRRE